VGFVSVLFSSPAHVTAGTQYAIVLPTTALPCLDGFWWGYVEGDPYSAGSAVEAFGSDPWQPLGLAGQDFAFKTYVQPADAAGQLAALINDVFAINARQGIISSLDAKLQTVQQALMAAKGGNRADACSKLGSFVHEVEAQYGVALTADEAARLLAAAGQIRTTLNCGS
jgi:hypothetical protein